jgi:hypothetical protein
MSYTPPPIAYSFNAEKNPRDVKFNKYFISRVVKEWEKITGKKCTIPILSCKEHAFFAYKKILISNCSVRSLLHELQHWRQSGKGSPVQRDMINAHYWIYPKYGRWASEMYYRLPTERDANREAKILAKKIYEIIT